MEPISLFIGHCLLRHGTTVIDLKSAKVAEDFDGAVRGMRLQNTFNSNLRTVQLELHERSTRTFNSNYTLSTLDGGSELEKIERDPAAFVGGIIHGMSVLEVQGSSSYTRYEFLSLYMTCKDWRLMSYDHSVKIGNHAGHESWWS